MNEKDDLQRVVALVEEHVRFALSNWDASSLSHCTESCDSLALAIAELTTAQRMLQEDSSAPDAPMIDRLRRLRADTDLFGKLVDASAAFCHGMAVRIGAGTGIVSDEFAPLEAAVSHCEA